MEPENCKHGIDGARNHTNVEPYLLDASMRLQSHSIACISGQGREDHQPHVGR